MDDIASIIADLVSAGVSATLVGRVASALAVAANAPDDTAAERRRAWDRERKRKLKVANSTGVSTGNSGIPPVSTGTPSFPDKELSPKPPIENNPSSLPSLSDLFDKSSEVETDSTTSKATVYSPRAKAGFDEFWSLYPNKVGKPDAIKAFGRAIQRVELPVMIEGLRAYSAKTDDRPWCNPSTWLNQDRWNDRPVARAGPQRPLRGAALLAEKLRQEIENEGYLDAEGADPQACERLAIGGPGVRR